MGYTLKFASRMNLATMTPQGELSSARYCLADPGSEYLIYQPESGSFTVDLQAFPEATFSVEWLDPETGGATSAMPVVGGSIITFNPAFGGPAVLYLKRE